MKRENRELELHDLIPWDYANRRWREGVERYPDDYRDTRPPERYRPDDRPRCETCGWPLGQRGFVRMSFPRGHELFGKAICCPDCWPEPFGHAEGGKLSQPAQRLAGLWRSFMAGLPVRQRERTP